MSLAYLYIILYLPSHLLVQTLPSSEGQTAVHVFNHVSEGQAERGKAFYIFNVVQPTVAMDIFSTDVPNSALRNQRDFYIVKNVEVSDGVLLEVMYFADGNPNVVYLGSLTTNISVIGKFKHTEHGMHGSCTVVSPGWMLATYTGLGWYV